MFGGIMFYIRSSVKAKKNNNNKIALDPDVRREEAADVGGDEGASNKPLKLGADECLCQLHHSLTSVYCSPKGRETWQSTLL